MGRITWAGEVITPPGTLRKKIPVCSRSVILLKQKTE